MDKIVGGVTAASPIPWQVSVRRGKRHFCGGTILNEWTILSAAHCFYAGYKGNYSILAGVVDRAQDESAQVNKDNQMRSPSLLSGPNVKPKYFEASN